MANKSVYPYGTGGTLPASIGIINDLYTGGADKALSAEQGKEIGEILGVPVTVGLPFSGMTHFKDGYQLKANSAQIGKELNNVTSSANERYVNVKVPIVGYSKLRMRSYSSSAEYGSLIVDANDVVLKGIINDTGTYYDMYVDIPANAAYLVYSYSSTASYSKDITLYKEDGVLPRLDALEENEDGGTIVPMTASGKSPELSVGRLNSNGEKVSGNYLTTEPIFGDFFLQLADGWRVYEGHLYDRSGKIVSYRHVNPNVSHTGTRGTWSNRLFFSQANDVPDYGIRLTLCKSDQSAIADGEMPVTNFVLLSDSGLHRWVPADLPKYDVALRRINYMQHLRWVPLSNVPNYNTSDYFNIAGRVAVGPPYSDVAETRTYVPNQVSLRTFMTAVRNKRSLLYTEDLSNNTSKYGRTYQSGNRGPYFGAVCSSFTAWVMGLEALYLSKEYGDNAVPGLSSVEYNSVDDLRPLDLIWNSGHVSIISDIYKDEFGAVKYIVWAEMSTPYPYRTFYTPDQFNARIVARSADVHRWDGWASIQEPEASEYSQYMLGDTRKEPKWNEDITTYAGDYAAFAEGDTIHLNARRNSVYTGVELYKNDVLLQTIDISGLSADTIVTPNTEDWVDVNLTTLNLAYGKYKARLTDGTNVTDFTYFEIIGITMSATRSSSQITVTFGANGGTPVSIEQVKQNGFADSDGNGKYHTITAEEITAGTMTLPWTFNSTYKYLLMLVRGDYGAVPKKILFPTN